MNRRDFLKSLFYLSSLSLIPSTIEAKTQSQILAGIFIWADLHTGQIFSSSPQINSNGIFPVSRIGSIMKLISTATLLEENLISPQKTYECRGIIKFQGKEYKCTKAHGKVSLIQALGHSCNVFFAQASQSISPTLFLDYCSRFGFDRSLYSQLSPPDPLGRGSLRKFFSLDQLSNVPNQGIIDKSKLDKMQSNFTDFVLGLHTDSAVNLLHIIQLTSLIALKGNMPKLFFKYSNSEHSLKPIKLHLSESTWIGLQNGMKLACLHGTARKLDPENQFKIAAKTGTIPLVSKNYFSKSSANNSNQIKEEYFQSLITGYFPYDNPQYVFCLLAPHGTSQETAVPLAHKEIFSHKW
ncbi:MAG: penicillin-binding transpeptidase domain-containing protein [Candidatus Melainabacteria bacterium]|jgi:cell division protein FtsI/penicillin-binding protein 2